MTNKKDYRQTIIETQRVMSAMRQSIKQDLQGLEYKPSTWAEKEGVLMGLSIAMGLLASPSYRRDLTTKYHAVPNPDAEEEV